MICKPNKDQKYDVWLHWNLTAQCNLNCEYCFGKIPVNKQNITSIDIEKLMGTLKKSGKTFRISFTEKKITGPLKLKLHQVSQTLSIWRILRWLPVVQILEGKRCPTYQKTQLIYSLKSSNK